MRDVDMIWARREREKQIETREEASEDTRVSSKLR